MQPVVHLVVGYCCYAAYTRFDRGEPPSIAPAGVAIVGAAVPDLLDKPLSSASVVPVGRTIGHSLLFAVPLVLLLWLLARRFDRSHLGVAFAIGYGSHLATDVPWHVISGDYHELGFLLWPVTPMPAYTGVKPLGTIPGVGLEATTLWLEAVIVVVGIVVWWLDGRPGLGMLWQAIDR
ncbi:metal-dependent hydrolase [Natronorubrum sulfidifaciens]|uniref:Membrane-bound metal-dependent hydrolase n=1 Tax=Natronorubrum sulfidifaciens JCM 14089 TaxID=1230460 RepID=L9W554_9EURY|nr:metal-dependent hydrolase [Natronorubrum sulfidifaciens]ELY44426.1 membrane-bound metal-dependent hydrolase [Natronorubrum sulfidifaciens JCM 14089]